MWIHPCYPVKHQALLHLRRLLPHLCGHALFQNLSMRFHSWNFWPNWTMYLPFAYFCVLALFVNLLRRLIQGILLPPGCHLIVIRMAKLSMVLQAISSFKTCSPICLTCRYHRQRQKYLMAPAVFRKSHQHSSNWWHSCSAICSEMIFTHKQYTIPQYATIWHDTSLFLHHFLQTHPRSLPCTKGNHTPFRGWQLFKFVRRMWLHRFALSPIQIIYSLGLHSCGLGETWEAPGSATIRYTACSYAPSIAANEIICCLSCLIFLLCDELKSLWWCIWTFCESR